LSPAVYAESLRIEAQLLGRAHPIAVTSLRVWPTRRPHEWRDIEAPRELPAAAREPGAGWFAFLLFWRENS